MRSVLSHLALSSIALLLLTPMALLLVQALDSSSLEHWQHLLDTWLGEALINTLLLAAISVGGALLLGASLAWMTLVYRFPGSRLLTWLLILPLALPPYVVAMMTGWWLDSGGTLHLWLSQHGLVRHWPDIRTLPLLGGLFALLFMPYVFLLARASFQRQGVAAFEAARALGLPPVVAFGRVVLPIARPALLAGAALVIMETLADYGASSLFSVPTLTQAIYRSWFNMGDAVLAAQLSLTLISGVALALLLLNRTSLQGQHASSKLTGAPRQMRPLSALLAALLGWGVFALAFALPVGLLLWQASNVISGTPWDPEKLLHWLSNSLLLAIITALLASLLAGWAGWMAYRNPHNPWQNSQIRLLALGYGVPGTALAVAILLTWQTLGLAAGAAALIFAYLVRFLSLSLHSTQAGLSQLSPRLLEAARLHGHSAWQQHRRITLPLLAPHLLAGALMVAVEVLKELPATLMLRPFNFDTLAVIAYQYAQDERQDEAAMAALLIVCASLLGLLIVKWLEKRHSPISA